MFSLQKHIHQTRMPKFNPSTARGVAVEHFTMLENYIDKLMECVEEGLPEGMEYDGPRRATPKEQWKEETRPRYSKRTFDITESNVYMMRYHFKYKGQKLPPINLYLPYVRPGGLIYLRGALYGISPVLTDRAVSVGQNSIYIPLTRDKLNFYRLVHHFRVDDRQENSFVIHSLIHHGADRKTGPAAPKTKMETSLAHYLFCKYGVREAFMKMANAEVFVGLPKMVNDKTFSPDEWHICHTTGLKPKTYTQHGYDHTDIRLAIRKKDWNPLTRGMVGGFFYVADHFPDRVIPEDVDDIRLWRILLGYSLFPKSGHSDGKHVIDMTTHIESLNVYIDKMAKDELADDGVFVDDLFELLAHVIETFPDRVLSASDSVNTMYDKRLSVLRYIAEPIIIKAFWFMYHLRNPKKKLTYEEIRKYMRKITRDAIFEINHNHGEVKSVASPNDNMIFNITSNMVLQADSKGTATAGGGGFNDPSKYLHASQAEVGSFSHLPKSEPSGRSKINPCLETKPDGTIVRNPEFQELLDKVQYKLRRF